MITEDRILIGGVWASPSGSESIDVISPATEERIARVPAATVADVDRAVAAARRAFDDGDWPSLPLADRAAYIAAMAELLIPQIEPLARLQVDEMGAPYTWMRRMTDARVRAMTTQASIAEQVQRREYRDGNVGKVVVMREPVGVVGAVIPWNGPIPHVLAKALPALLSGCPVIIKTAPETPVSSYAVAEAAVAAGLPAGLLSIVAGGREIGEHLVTHPGIDKVSFTGSTAVGARIGALCGERLTRVSLELGGKSAAIVLDDADLERDMDALINSSMPNSGQICHATTRLLVSNRRRDELVERLTAKVGSLKVGNPQEDDTYFGPLVAERQRERVEGLIRSGVEDGATIALGGTRPPLDRGWYVAPTIFTNVTSGMRIAQEEIFGPVVTVTAFETEQEAVDIANDSDYGLGGAVYTEDIDRGIEIAARIRTGTCSINAGPAGGGGGPFGGYKRSGIGREHGREGFEEFFELKSIALAPGVVPAPEPVAAAN